MSLIINFMNINFAKCKSPRNENRRNFVAAKKNAYLDHDRSEDEEQDDDYQAGDQSRLRLEPKHYYEIKFFLT